MKVTTLHIRSHLLRELTYTAIDSQPWTTACVASWWAYGCLLDQNFLSLKKTISRGIRPIANTQTDIVFAPERVQKSCKNIPVIAYG